MSVPRTILVAAAAILLPGCVTETTHRGIRRPADNLVGQKLSDATASVERSWKRMLAGTNKGLPPRWEWASAIPNEVPRAELLSPTLPAAAVAAFAPQIDPSRVVLASTAQTQPSWQVAVIAGRPLKNFADLHTAVEQVVSAGKPAQVDLASLPAAPGAAPSAVKLEPSQLVALSHAAAADVPAVRVTEDGNSWVLVRQVGVRSKLLPRVERRRGLLQLAVSLGVCWGPPAMLPVEVLARCDGKPLRCLSVAQTLELLYGDPRLIEQDLRERSCSFATVSERDDYLVPTNFKRLEETLSRAIRRSVDPPPLPALATVPGVAYPGPAVLGDARALTGFLLQRQTYQAGEAERIGWILFSGDALRRGRQLEIDIDLGRGPQSLRFSFPLQ